MAAAAVPTQEEKKQEYPNYIGETNDISTELACLKKKYGKNWSDLYDREYEYVQPFDYKNNNVATLNLMQFNILADGLSGVHVSENIKDAESQKKTFIDVPKESLIFEYRGFRILEEITRNEPGIICLEECDQFDFLSHYLSPFGYKGEFNPKSNSPCIKIAKQNNINLSADGIAIFYNSKKYKIKTIQKFGKSIEQNVNIDIPAINILFLDIATNKTFIVCAAHLKSTKNINGEIIRLNQLQHLLPNIQKLAAENKDIPVFFACDLNTNNYEQYSMCYSSIMFPSKISDKKKQSLPKDYIDGYGMNLWSAYYDFSIPNNNKKQNAEPIYTTYKKRAGGTVKHTIDYIFYTKQNAKVVRLLSIPDEKIINTKTYLPGYEYPSDHIALQACFQF